MIARVSRCFATIALLATPIAIPLKCVAQEPQWGAQQLHYRLEVLGTLGNPSDSEAHGLNNRDSVAGQSFLPDDALHAFFWRKGVTTDLDTLGGPDSFVNVANHTVNERDVVVGYSETPTPDPNAENFCNSNPTFAHNLVCLPFAWENGVMTPLPTLGGTNGQALGINNRNQIVGQAEGPNPDPCSPFALQVSAVVWRNGQIEQVLFPFGGTAAVAAAINDEGDAVGLSGCNTSTFYPVLWRHGKPINLGSLGGLFGNIPFDINNRDQVVGQSDLPDDSVYHGFLWEKGNMTDLGSLAGLPLSLANAINDKGQVVGFSQDINDPDDATTVAWLWQGGVMTDLNSLIPSGSALFLMEAVAINDHGEIGGWGRLSNGDIRPFLLTPCLEGPDQDCQSTGEDTAIEPDLAPRSAPHFTQSVRSKWVHFSEHATLITK